MGVCHSLREVCHCLGHNNILVAALVAENRKVAAVDIDMELEDNIADVGEAAGGNTEADIAAAGMVTVVVGMDDFVVESFEHDVDMAVAVVERVVAAVVDTS